MSTEAASEGMARRGLLAKARRRFGALPAGIISGGVVGAVVGGIGGRIVMRLVALIDESTDGAKTDFATVGEITLGGSFTLLALSAITGVIGGVLYVALRQWLPWSHVARGAFFGLLMMFGPGVIFLGEVDLQIFEPAVPVFAMFVGLIVLYGVGVGLLTDRLSPAAPRIEGRRTQLVTRGVQGLLALGICAMAVFVTLNVHDKGGSCLSADDNGGCAARAEGR